VAQGAVKITRRRQEAAVAKGLKIEGGTRTVTQTAH